MFIFSKKFSLLLIFFMVLFLIVSCSSNNSIADEVSPNTNPPDSSKLADSEEQPSESSLETNLDTQELNIIPLEFEETTKFYHPPFPAEDLTGMPDTYLSVADPGWKFVNVRLAFENPSRNFVTVKPWGNLPDIKLKTEQDWLYELDTSFLGGMDSVFLPF